MKVVGFSTCNMNLSCVGHAATVAVDAVLHGGKPIAKRRVQLSLTPIQGRTEVRWRPCK